MKSNHTIQRIRHELVSRKISVAATETLTPRVVRITFESPELEGFISPEADDHIAIFVPSDEEPDGESKRHFTPRSYDPKQRRLTIDFALHQSGPASDWARQARPGQELWIGGPKNSLVVPTDFDWYLLIGDESAWPAMARRLESLPAGSRAITLATLFDEREQQTIETASNWSAHWIARGEPSQRDAALLLESSSRLELPAGDGFVWIAGEASVVRALRAHFLERGHPSPWLHASSYWKLGQPDVHEVFED